MGRPRTKCPGPGNMACPDKSPIGPRGGICTTCRRIRLKATQKKWFKSTLNKDYKAISPKKIREDVAVARRVAGETLGIKGALSVIAAMQRVA